MVATPEALEALRGIRDRARELRRHWNERRLLSVEWLPHQLELLEDPSLYRLLRTGNQLGKTEVGLAEVLYAARGEHPYRKPTREAGEYWVVCASWGQSLAIQRKLYALCPRDWLRPGTAFSRERAFGGRYPSVSIRHASSTPGDERWSVVRFKTTGQETLDLSADTIDGALFDEPPRSETVYSEVQKRVQANNGWILLTLTPIGADVSWLRDLVRSGEIREHHARLEAELLVPVGRTEPLRIRDKGGHLHRWDQAWIDVVVRRTPESEREIRIDGEWDIRPVDAYFGGVWVDSRDTITLDDLEAEREGWDPELDGVIACLGIDHGHRPGKQYACLLEVDDRDPARPSIDLVDEYTDALGLADPRRDARGILEMLERAGWQWRDLAFAGGDRDHMPGTEHRKSNRDLELAIRAELGLHDLPLHPRIRTVKRGAGRGKGSVVLGCKFLWRAMADRRFRVSKHCVKARGAVRRFRLRTVDDEWKDVVDGIRYGLDPFVFYRAGSSAVSVRFG